MTTTTAARGRERVAIRDRIMRDAEREARRLGRSLKCAGDARPGRPWHADEPGGCANDGTGCLCECHDPT